MMREGKHYQAEEAVNEKALVHLHLMKAAVAGATVWKGYPGCSRSSGGEHWEAGVAVAQVKEDGSLD